MCPGRGKLHDNNPLPGYLQELETIQMVTACGTKHFACRWSLVWDGAVGYVQHPSTQTHSLQLHPRPTTSDKQSVSCHML